MGIEKGSSTFKLLASEAEITETIEVALKERSYADMPSNEESSVTDITRGVSLANGKPEGDYDFRYGNSWYFAVRTREKIVDAKMVKEYLSLLIDKEFKATGFMPKSKKKKELKQLAQEAMRSNAVTKTNGVRIVVPTNTKMLIAETSGGKKFEETLTYLSDSVFKDNSICVITPEYLYDVITKTNSSGYVSYSVCEKTGASGIGVDFLTWLWMASETEGVLPKEIKATPFGYIEFRNDASCPTGAMITKMTKGSPWEGDGPKAAFDDGKKVCSAMWRFTKDDKVSYDVAIDENFTFKGFKVEGDEEKVENPEEAFSNAVVTIQIFSALFIDVFKTFLSKRDQNEELIKKWYEKRWMVE